MRFLENTQIHYGVVSFLCHKTSHTFPDFSRSRRRKIRAFYGVGTENTSCRVAPYMHYNNARIPAMHSIPLPNNSTRKFPCQRSSEFPCQRSSLGGRMAARAGDCQRRDLKGGRQDKNSLQVVDRRHLRRSHPATPHTNSKLRHSQGHLP